jgi:hypothetical protein
MIRPSEDLALYRADMAEWDGRRGQPDWRESRRDWVRANDACRLDILDRLGASGPLPSRDLPDTGGQASSSAERSLSSISHAWSSVWKAECRMRNGSVHDRMRRLTSPALYARIAAT